ncbi:MAG: Crp/Fnr family transcriptional regulator [Elusimicrobia bacterium]|nr:Crp/Fnr family transcriptional regulator [Elusimicrobiota bacterium]
MLKLLRKIPFLSVLSPKELKKVRQIGNIHEYAPGERVFSQTESADQMFVVLSGQVKIFAASNGKKRKTFTYLQAGDFFGEMALLEGKTRSASAEAVQASKLLTIKKGDFHRLLCSDHQLTIYLLRAFSERLRKADEEIEGLLFRNVLGRVSKTLCDLSQKGESFKSGRLLRQHYTQQELADLVGTTREPLTRALSALRRADLVEVHAGRYFIKNPQKLSALCLT